MRIGSSRINMHTEEEERQEKGRISNSGKEENENSRNREDGELVDVRE